MNIKTKIQKNVIQEWYGNSCKGLALLATGSGKSKIFIDIVSKEKKKWLLVVPTEKLRDRNWKDEFIKWSKTSVYTKYVNTCCYASLKNVDLSLYDGVCLDECHNITVNNVQPFKNHVDRLKILCLTATKPTDFDKQYILENMLKCNIIYNLSLKKAVELGIVAPLNIIVHELKLSTVKDIPVKYKDKNGNKQVFYQSEQGSYDYLCQKIARKAKPTQFDYIFRAKFIYDSKTKTEYAKKLLKELPKDKRILVFSQSINQIESIMKETYHSKTDDKFYNSFIKEEIKRLGVVSSLNEGENIPNLDIGVIVQGNSNPKNTFQRIGRIIRYREGHTADIHLIILKDTVDELWYQEILKDYQELITIIK